MSVLALSHEYDRNPVPRFIVPGAPSLESQRFKQGANCLLRSAPLEKSTADGGEALRSI